VDSRGKSLCHIAVVGGGQAAKWLLHALSEQLACSTDALQGVSITVIERGQEFATGLAWSRQHVLETHLASRASRLSRWEYGSQQRQKFHRTIALLQALDVAVSLRTGQEVVRISRTRHEFELKLSSGEYMTASTVVLATGYGISPWRGKSLDPDKFDGHPGVHSSPWPATRLQEAVFDGASNATAVRSKSVLILGTYLNAIDATLALAQRAGSFGTDARGRVHYDAPAGFRICMASRSGQLPRVWGRQPLIPHPPRAFTSERLRNSLEHSIAGPFLPLDTALDLLATELSVPPRGRQSAKADTNTYQKQSTRERFRVWRKALARADRGEMLRRDIASVTGPGRTSGSYEDLRECSWQTSIDASIAIWSEHSGSFSAEDQIYFDSELRTSFFNHMLPMTLESAVRLEAMMRAERLTVVALGRNFGLITEHSGPHRLMLSFPDNASGTRMAKFTDVVDATGQPTDITAHPSPLMRDLLRDGLIQPSLRAFRNPAAADASPAARIEFHAGRPYLVGNGMYVNPQTCEVIPRGHHEPSHSSAGSGAMYAMGRNLAGQYVDAQSIWQVQRDGQRIASDILRKLIRQPHLREARTEAAR
jgi:uncharacterized NAD(P)/FAD-binding protein YdhS